MCVRERVCVCVCVCERKREGAPRHPSPSFFRINYTLAQPLKFRGGGSAFAEGTSVVAGVLVDRERVRARARARERER